MANIREIKGKTGTSYKITVTHGRDLNGKQIRHYQTWTPEPKMTQLQIKKALNAAAVDFERKILEGFAVDNRQTFAAYAEYVLGLKERTDTKFRTLEYYRELLARINEGIGHLRLTDIRPKHLNDLYANLGESGIRKNGCRATPKMEIAPILKEKGYSRAKLAEEANISASTVSAITMGKRVNLSNAEAVCTVLDENIKHLFSVETNDEPLSTKTQLDHHKLIRNILKQAEKELIVPYNAATRATPPKLSQTEATTFQPDEVMAIRDALEFEPLKWKVIIHLLLVSGCRRGEIAGLMFDKIDWHNNQIKIDQALLYSPKKGLYVSTTKTSTTRFIKLPSETMDLLYEYSQWYNELRTANGDRWQDTGFLFVQDNGEPAHPDSINTWLRKFSNRHNLPPINPHKFRHTMASLLYFNGVDGIAISKRLGHAKVSTTTDIYSHIIKQADEQAAESIADSILRIPAAPKKKMPVVVPFLKSATS